MSSVDGSNSNSSRRTADRSARRATAPKRHAPSVDIVRRILLGAAETMRDWDDRDLREFMNGKRDLVIRARTTSPIRANPSKQTAAIAAGVRDQLGAMETREQGLAYLEGLSLSRDELRRLVSALDLPMGHSDNMTRLRARVVEALIGYRLRSEAIRGESSQSKKR